MSESTTPVKAPKSTKKRSRSPRTPLATALAFIAAACADAGSDLGNAPPKMLTIRGISHQIEHDQQGRVNGVNLVLTVPSLVISKELKIEETDEGQVFNTPMTRVTEACGLQQFGPLQAYAHNADIWNGTKGDKDATWLFHNVPCSPALVKIFESLCAKLTKNPEAVEQMRQARLLHSVETKNGIVHSLHIPFTALKGQALYLFCPIGSEGTPVLNFNEGIVSTTPGISNATVVRNDEPQQNGRAFRGKFAQSNRAKQVAADLWKQISESEAWKSVQEVKGPTRQERQGNTQRRGPSRFLNQAPAPMAQAPAEAIADLKF